MKNHPRWTKSTALYDAYKKSPRFKTKDKKNDIPSILDWEGAPRDPEKKMLFSPKEKGVRSTRRFGKSEQGRKNTSWVAKTSRFFPSPVPENGSYFFSKWLKSGVLYQALFAGPDRTRVLTRSLSSRSGGFSSSRRSSPVRPCRVRRLSKPHGSSRAGSGGCRIWRAGSGWVGSGSPGGATLDQSGPQQPNGPDAWKGLVLLFVVLALRQYI